MSRKPDKRLQLLRGARLALQHFEDAFHASTRADMELLSDIHARETRQLTNLGRIAYDHWEPTSDLRERVCR